MGPGCVIKEPRNQEKRNYGTGLNREFPLLCTGSRTEKGFQEGASGSTETGGKSSVAVHSRGRGGLHRRGKGQYGLPLPSLLFLSLSLARCPSPQTLSPLSLTSSLLYPSLTSLNLSFTPIHFSGCLSLLLLVSRSFLPHRPNLSSNIYWLNNL